MKEFISNYWLSILIAMGFVALLLFLWKRGKRDLVKRIIYAAVCRAEQLYGSKTGPIKLAEVWASLYGRLPLIIRIIFPRKELEGYIEASVKLLKMQLASGDMNLLNYNQEVESVIDSKITR